jgi:O-phosphoseryl-tRNA(Sec) kinase
LSIKELEHPFLIIFCGLPSAGKTMFAQKLQSQLVLEFKKEVTIIDTDLLREKQYGTDFSPENESKIRESALKQCRDFLIKGDIVISDDINYFESMRHELVQIAQDLNIPYFIIYISTPLEVCLKWNRQRNPKIDDNIILKIYQKFDIPGIKYSWDIPFLQIDLSKQSNQDKFSMTVQKIIESLHNKKKNHLEKNIKTLKKEFTVTKSLNIVDKITRKCLGLYTQISNGKKVQKNGLDDLSLEIYAVLNNNLKIKSLFEAVVKILGNNMKLLNKKRRSFLANHKADNEDQLGVIVILESFLLFLKN